MGNLSFIPIVVQLALNLKEFNVGFLVFVDGDSGQASAFFHLGITEEDITFDIFYLQGILAYLSR